MKTKYKDTSDKTVPIVPMNGIQQHWFHTKQGNSLSFFYNSDNNLLVVDIGNESGGLELLRMTLNEKNLLSHTN